MLSKINELVEELNKSGISYCHWKSNLALAESLAGQTDIDLLVHRKDANLFRAILSRLCFKPAVITDGASFPSVEHYFALDRVSGTLAHVHVYFRVITGESLTKNYRLPIEEMLLQHTREMDSVRVPTPSAELVVFTLRMMLKHTSLMELVLLARYWKHARQEIEWLLENSEIDKTLSFVNCWLPSLNTELFSECVEALASPASFLRRLILGHRLRSQLRPYARHSNIRAWLSGVHKFTLMFFRRLNHSPRGMIPQSGGAIIAFVGPEATGKSTLLTEMRSWLGEHFAVKQVHAGKPKSTILSAVPNLLVPALRFMLPTSRSSHVETRHVSKENLGNSDSDYPLIFAIRSALLAYDRRALLSQAFGRAANGTVVLCDRYPSLLGGAPDSPQLAHLPIPPNQYSVRRLLARIEARLYRAIPPPDMVIYLSAPLEVTLSRNAVRAKKEPEDYVRHRHARSSKLEFERTPVCKINTDQPIDQTILKVKEAIWNTL